MSSACTLCLVLCLQAAAPAPDIQPATPRSCFTVTWDTSAPAAGTTVKLRVRGAALAALLSADGIWRLEAAGKEVPAMVIYPEPQLQPAAYSLPFTQQASTKPDTSVLIIDRGASAPELNTLALTFGDLRVRAKVSLAESADQSGYAAVGTEHVLYQELSADGLLSLTDFAAPVSGRYLKLTLTSDQPLTVQSVIARAEQLDVAPTYDVTAALGPMREQSRAGEHLWPIILPDNGIYLAAMTIDARPADAVRRISLVTLADDLQPLDAVAETVWTGELNYLGATRQSRRLQCTPAYSPGGWGLLVENGKQSPLQLSSIRVQAAEVYLACTPPAAAALELWTGKPRSLDYATAPAIEATVRAAGSFDKPSAPSLAGARSPASGQTDWKLWLAASSQWRWACYAAAALAALVVGLWLIRGARAS